MVVMHTLAVNVHKSMVVRHIKTSGSKLQPSKVELMHVHIKNAMTTVGILHITMELVNTPTKQPYRIDIIIQ